MHFRVGNTSRSAMFAFTLFLATSIALPTFHRPAFAKEKIHQWTKGLLVDVSTRDASRLVNGTSYEKLYWTYTIDDGHYIWKLQRDTNRRDKPLDITINAPVEFAIEGQKAFLKDDSGAEHSLSVQAKALKVAPSL